MRDIREAYPLHHFFLAHYFRDTYDRNMAQLPTIMSGVVITRAELWVTNNNWVSISLTAVSDFKSSHQVS